MLKGAHFSHRALVFHGMELPEEGTVVGYAAIIHKLKLEVSLPERLSVISDQHRKYDDPPWAVFPKTYLPADNRQISALEALYKHLVFALKYEGVNLLAFKKIAQHYEDDQLTELVSYEPTGQYARRIWFLIEWLLEKTLSGKPAIAKKSYVKALDETLQYGVAGKKSPRHLVINNLPGNRDFCPLIFKTPRLEQYIREDLAGQKRQYLQGIRKDILQRASAFLLLKGN